MHDPQKKSDAQTNRRGFLKTSAAMAGTVAIGSLAISRAAHASGSDTLKVGLVGCGERGSGAAVNALNADPNAKLVAMADLFPAKMRYSRKNIQNIKGDQVAVADEHCFAGFDGCRKVIESDVDVVILALPSFFHPLYLKACVDAGKHVFCEKIHAVDAPGVRLVQEAGEVATRKNLNIVSGLAFRYYTAAQEAMKRLHDGAIGEIIGMQATCNMGSLRCRHRQPGWTEMEYQLQDWFNFCWLSGDLPCLSLIHYLDQAAWAMREEPPVNCWGTGGRQVRVGPQYGDVWDHNAMVFQYANGARMYAYCRSQDGCPWQMDARIFGTKGRCDLPGGNIVGENPWHYEGRENNRFDAEHVALFSAIRSGNPINNSLYMARSSMLAIMGTWACFTGQVIGWEQAVKSNYVAAPKNLSLDAEPPTKPDGDGRYPVPIPGITQFM